MFRGLVRLHLFATFSFSEQFLNWKLLKVIYFFKLAQLKVSQVLATLWVISPLTCTKSIKRLWIGQPCSVCWIRSADQRCLGHLRKHKCVKHKYALLYQVTLSHVLLCASPWLHLRAMRAGFRPLPRLPKHLNSGRRSQPAGECWCNQPTICLPVPRLIKVPSLSFSDWCMVW